MQKQRSATPFDGVGIGGDDDAADLDVPNISKALETAQIAKDSPPQQSGGSRGRLICPVCHNPNCPGGIILGIIGALPR